ncbi:ACT domain-containing protein [Scheffersomyces xylosifermentans]|uniref:ACT domain-containing protein n=1 Tax=Scheffersomyces xylosifermentans TaxID=1304137 RepID=UPI00315CB4C8
MNTQVHLNPTKLSILSVPRDKYWIFTASVLQLLYGESSKGSSTNNNDFSSDSDDDEDSSERKTSDYNKNEAGSSRKPIPNLNDDEISSFGSNVRSSIDSHSRNHSEDIGPSTSGTNRRSVDNSSKIHSHGSSDSLENNYSNAYDSDPDNDPNNDNYFFHIALTPVECTIICASELMQTLFVEPIEVCKKLQYEDVKLIDESFLSLQVDSDGSFDNSLRILELTKPLSENNISLFFLSSHFNDIVLIPYSLKEKVVSILTKKNFEFSDISNSYIMTNNESTEFEEEGVEEELGSKFLEEKTFKLFSERNIKPVINGKVKLLLTGARAGEVNNTILKCAKILSGISNTISEYFAITRTSINEVSLILPKSSRRRGRMGFDSKNIIGSTQDIIIPISIDFSKLPLDSTGIVAGVASKLVNGVKHYNDSLFEMNYFSMARSGIIMIPQENVEIISDVLNNIDYDGDAKDDESTEKIASLAL